MEETSSEKHADQITQPRVAIVPSPGMGHLIPLAEFAKRLVVRHSLAVTFIVPNDGSPMEPQRKLLHSLGEPISAVFLPLVSFDDLPGDSLIETRISLSLTRSMGALRESFKALAESTRLVALIVDLFGPEAFDVAKEFNVPSYMFFPSNALVLSVALHLPILDETTSFPCRDSPEPVELRGCRAVRVSDVMDIHDKDDPVYKVVLRAVKRYNEAAGLLVNSYVDLEPGPFKAFQERADYNNPPVYPIGPVIRTGSISSDPCMTWLDGQPEGSVLFVSFGSGGTLSQAQITELAFALEMSGVRFLWVAKAPHETASNAAYFNSEGSETPRSDYLPEGFLDRTKGSGLVVERWAPQVEVLSHSSTGGFLSHCGWNSILESIVHGVPLIAWPLFAEQRANAILVADDIKVGIRVRADGNGLVGREEIRRCVRELMMSESNDEIRKRAMELKEKASLALSEQGSSTKSLEEVVQMWTKNNM